MRELKILNKYKYHSIGQGLFYSGRFEYDSFKYEYVIDCGTLSKREYIKDAVKIYSERTKNVDLLIISHLHDDHFSGIKYFKDNNIEVDTCILPYIGEIERLYLYFKYLEQNKSCNDYKELFVNPSKYLIDNLNVKNIIYIYNNSHLDNSKIKFYHSKEDYKKENKDKKHVIEGNIVDKSLVNGDTYNIEDSRVSIFTTINLTLESYIEFDFFNIVVDNKILDRFKNTIINKEENKTISEFIKENKNGIKDIICENNTEYIDILSNAYKIIDKKINNTSLCVSITSKPNANGKIKIGKIFTGDISLKKKSIYTSFINHYNRKLNDLNIFTLPHHGSHHNWNKDILSKLNRDCILVISSDPKNKKYNHPNKSVIYDITYEDRKIKYVDLEKSFNNIY